ncbi:MAG: hypothetical protein KDK26_06175 [Roseivivax sp.]|nr:hypothetical protein [Roseivivax sp.]
MTRNELRDEKARAALAVLEQAWAYYTPEPRIVARSAEAADRQSVFPAYYAA